MYIRYKADIIHLFIIDSKSSIVSIADTWQTDNDSINLKNDAYKYTYFDIMHATRLLPYHIGGLVLLYSSELKFLSSSIPSNISC